MANLLVSSSTRPNWAWTFSLTSSFFFSISSSLALKVERADLDISSSSLDRLLLKLRLPELCCNINWFRFWLCPCWLCGCSIDIFPFQMTSLFFFFFSRQKILIKINKNEKTETLLLPWFPPFILLLSIFLSIFFSLLCCFLFVLLKWLLSLFLSLFSLSSIALLSRAAYKQGCSFRVTFVYLLL